MARRKGFGKNKGNAFERTIAKTLSLWVSGGTRDDLYWRTAGSGGRATTRRRVARKGTVNADGDIGSESPIGRLLIETFHVECKRYNKLEAERLVFNNTGFLVSTWKHLVSDSRIGKKRPMLIAKQDHRDAIIVLCHYGEMIFQADEQLPCLCYVPELDMYIYSLEEFLAKMRNPIDKIEKRKRYAARSNRPTLH